MNGTLAAVIARTESARALHPKLFGALLITGGALLILSALPAKSDPDARNCGCPPRP